MTVFTKSAFSEKKGDKLEAPLVDNEQLPATAPSGDPESGWTPQRIVIIPGGLRARRVSPSTTLCLLVVALGVVSVGVVAGKILYSEFLSVSRRMQQQQQQQQQRANSDALIREGRLEGFAQIPISDDDPDYDVMMKAMDFAKWESQKLNKILNGRVFQENFEIDDENKYEKLDVPDFRDGRSGRFIHDFNSNITGIIDITGHRCFVMPLNREVVLPPKSLSDLFQKMSDGYYKVDTNLVRESMRVVTPPVDDLESVGAYIANECHGMNIYRLEKFVGGVAKRSADLHAEAKFAQFAGKGILELDIVNLEDATAYEKLQKEESR